MRKFPLIPCTLFGLALSFGSLACEGDDGSGDGTADGTDTNSSGDGDGDPTTSGDGDPTTSGDGDSGGCFEAPEECLRFVECLGVILPDQQGPAAEQLGADGSCWCGTEEEALGCYDTCVAQLDAAITANPTVGECHGRYCPIEELNLDEPYGPVVNGGCPDGETPVNNPAGLPGSYCAPTCSGVANFCEGHSQSNGNGVCAFNAGDSSLCALTCFVDPYEQLGTQCPCGATCQPWAALGAGQGICTFE